MKAKLKLTKGSNAGKTFDINVPQFVIGRAPGCNLRPQSDAISRQHCAILLHADHVSVRDLKSRNGTILNGERLTTEQHLTTGDELQVGPLMFEVIVTQDDGAVRLPGSTSVVEQAHQIAGLPSDSGLISDWLLEEDMRDKQSKSVAETRQFQIDESTFVPIVGAEAPGQDEKAGKSKKGKPEFGKLPKQEKDNTASSRDAAADTLKKMFQRGT